MTAGTVAGVLYERYATRVHRVCMERLGDRDEAADAVQDTFLRAWLALRAGVEVRHPLPWLLTIADNVCVSRFRARRARVTTTPLRDVATVEHSEAVVEVAGLTAALRTLPVRQRQALVRRELQGYSYDEIGAELGVSRASVAALLHRARSAVATALHDARRGIAAIVPVPAVLRASFESGGAASLALAGTAVVAVTQLAGTGPTPSPPAPKAAEASAAVIVPSTDAARRGPHRHVERPVAHDARTAGAATPARSTGSTARRDDAVAVLATTTVVELEPPSDPRRLPGTSPEDGSAEQPTPGPPAPTETADQPPPAPASAPTEQAAHSAPGKQPRGDRGRSEYAPGIVTKPEHPARGNGADRPASDPENAGAKTREDPDRGGKASSSAGAPPVDGNESAPQARGTGYETGDRAGEQAGKERGRALGKGDAAPSIPEP